MMQDTATFHSVSTDVVWNVLEGEEQTRLNFIQHIYEFTRTYLASFIWGQPCSFVKDDDNQTDTLMCFNDVIGKEGSWETTFKHLYIAEATSEVWRGISVCTFFARITLVTF